MGDKVNLKLTKREVHGKKVKNLRRDGLVPGVVYGPGTEPIAVQAPDNLVAKAYREAGRHHPVYLDIEGKKKIAMIKHADVDPVKNNLRHLSFHAVKQNEKVEAEIPVRLKGEGESEAEKAGLIILQNIEELEVRALPMDLPDFLEADITGLKESGERVTVGDIKLGAGIELVDKVTQQKADADDEDDDEQEHSVTELVVASVWEPSALQAANEAAAGDAEDESEVESENGEDTDQESQAGEDKPGGKDQAEPKQSNVDANK
ncbi:MAG TPA: 50S ribosomal protein L25 [Candidatus Saccharimonadales bacterium]|nr:50S ribosomal protein L25 [Candidatus Saccharimonadales bacterium]